MKLSYPLNLPFNVTQKWNEGQTFYNSIGLRGHNGWDFGCVVGTPVYASHEGIISFAEVDSVMSLTVSIDTLDKKYRTLYCHLSEAKVKNGDHVTRGQLIALSGNSGRYTTGPHLHFGLRPINPDNMDNGYNGAIDPSTYWDGTYPSTPVVHDIDNAFSKMMFAVRDYQIANGVVDFANETDPKKIKLGPKTLQLITRDTLN